VVKVLSSHLIHQRWCCCLLEVLQRSGIGGCFVCFGLGVYGVLGGSDAAV